MKYVGIIAVVFLSACVSTKKYKDLQSEKNNLEQSLKNKLKECEGTAELRMQRIVELEGKEVIYTNKLAILQDSLTLVKRKLDENAIQIKSLETQIAEQSKKLKEQIDDKNKNIQTKELELRSALAKAEEERLKLQKAEQELLKKSERVRILERELYLKDSVTKSLKDAVVKALSGFDNLDIQVENRNGKVYVRLAEKLLFKSGSIKVDPKGKDALIKLSEALNKNKDIQINVEGHTDNKPMNSETIKDNLDLSVLRATSIARILISDGKIVENRITASGKGESQPIADNATAEGRAKNRRTEIILTPRLDKILDIINN